MANWTGTLKAGSAQIDVEEEERRGTRKKWLTFRTSVTEGGDLINHELKEDADGSRENLSAGLWVCEAELYTEYKVEITN